MLAHGLGLWPGAAAARANPLTTVLAEFDASDAASLTLTGANVDSWASRRGNTGLLSSGATKPTKDGTPQRIVFSGSASDDLTSNATLNGVGNSISTALSIVALVKINDTGADHSLVQVGVNPYERCTLFFGAGDKSCLIIYRLSSGGTIEYVFTPAGQIPVTPAWRLLCFSIDPDNGEAFAWTNRTRVTTGSAPSGAFVATALNQMRVGGPGFGDMAFEIAYLALTDYPLDDALVARLAAYCEDRFRVTL